MNVWVALVCAVFVWWFATGAILFLDGLPRRTFRWTILGATALTGIAYTVLVVNASDTSTSAAYTAFACAIVIWGWNEIAFLMGGITGPRRNTCPVDAKGWRRFGLAFQTLLYHEAMIAGCGLLIVAITWNAPNKVALWTFLVLWIMRASAKLNIFLGVPNITHEFLPSHLGYLKSYFRFSSPSRLLPISIGAGVLAAIWLAACARAAPAASFEEAGFMLLASLTALAVVEHIFMVVPLPSSALWGWAMRTPALSVSVSSKPRSISRAGGDR